VGRFYFENAMRKAILKASNKRPSCLNCLKNCPNQSKHHLSREQQSPIKKSEGHTDGGRREGGGREEGGRFIYDRDCVRGQSLHASANTSGEGAIARVA